jgi:hypothetical protein
VRGQGGQQPSGYRSSSRGGGTVDGWGCSGVVSHDENGTGCVCPPRHRESHEANTGHCGKPATVHHLLAGHRIDRIIPHAPPPTIPLSDAVLHSCTPSAKVGKGRRGATMFTLPHSPPHTTMTTS